VRTFVLAVGLLLIISAGYANAALPQTSILSEVWFTENGHLMVEFSTMGMNSIPLNEIVVINSGEQEYREAFQDSTIIIDSSAVVIDITETMPNMVFNPDGDTLIIGHMYNNDLENYSYLDRLIWGNDPFSDTNPPQPGQSMAHSVKWTEYNYEMWPYFKWVIDEPPTPGTNCFNPVARSLLKVKITDLNNDPVPYALLFFYSVTDNCLTDENGELNEPIFPGRFDISIQHPIYAESVLNQIYMVEPYDTLSIPLQITMPGSYPYDNLKKLRAYPVPYNRRKAYFLTFKYYGEIKKDSYIKLYDIKGRFISKIPFDTNGFINWHPDEAIGSGMYFARMINGNKIVDTATITIIK
jgi:hypothetical protein